MDVNVNIIVVTLIQLSFFSKDVSLEARGARASNGSGGGIKIAVALNGGEHRIELVYERTFVGVTENGIGTDFLGRVLENDNRRSARNQACSGLDILYFVFSKR